MTSNDDRQTVTVTDAHGITWRVVRSNPGAAPRESRETVGWAEAVDPETGTRIQSATIRGTERELGSPRIVRQTYHDGRVSVYVEFSPWSTLTDANRREIASTLETAAAGFAAPTHAERVANLIESAKLAGRTAAADAWRRVVEWDSPTRHELTRDDVAAIAAALVEGFAARAGEGH